MRNNTRYEVAEIQFTGYSLYFRRVCPISYKALS
jgi:hypothetical protein